MSANPTTPVDADHLPLTRAEQDLLLRVARDSIAHGLQRREPLLISPQTMPPRLGTMRASFVTLRLLGQLRGCIGTVQAMRPMVADVAINAFGAAFRDPRFRPVSVAELVHLKVSLSILTPPRPMTFTSEDDLLGQLRPGVDGLVLEDGPRRGTFLPAVWDTLAEPTHFLRHLKQKAGLPVDHWSDTLRVSRYTAQGIGD